MEVWTFITQKGGAGKSTLATNMAVHAGEEGEKVLLLDVDFQSTSTKWWERRDEEYPDLKKIRPEEFDEALNLAKRQGYSLVLVDTAGVHALELHNTVVKADFCIIPAQPSIADIEAVFPTVELMKRAAKNFSFVLTRCPAVGQDQVAAREGLSGLGLVAKPFTVERKAYKNSLAQGLGVTEYDPQDKATMEIKELFKLVKNKSRRLAAA